MNEQDQITVLKWTVALEAQNQEFHGKLGVAYVVTNRARLHKMTIAEVCFQKWQFSCWTPENGLAHEIKMLQATPDSVMYDCGLAAEYAVRGRLSDPTGGATHYLNIELTKQQNGGKLPSWVSKLVHTVKIGDHDFYKEAYLRV